MRRSLRSNHAALTGPLLALLIAMGSMAPAMAALRQSAGSGGGNWNAPATWAGGIVPTTGDDVEILVGDIVNMNVNA
ncbi:MAG: hypothetical protein ACK4L7_09290, partial [Flavobacteriales bacterium]